MASSGQRDPPDPDPKQRPQADSLLLDLRQRDRGGSSRDGDTPALGGLPDLDAGQPIVGQSERSDAATGRHDEAQRRRLQGVSGSLGSLRPFVPLPPAATTTRIVTCGNSREVAAVLCSPEQEASGVRPTIQQPIAECSSESCSGILHWVFPRPSCVEDEAQLPQEDLLLVGNQKRPFVIDGIFLARKVPEDSDEHRFIVSDGKLVFAGHKDSIGRLAAVDRDHFASCSWDKSVLIWECKFGDDIRPASGVKKISPCSCLKVESTKFLTCCTSYQRPSGYCSLFPSTRIGTVRPSIGTSGSQRREGGLGGVQVWAGGLGKFQIFQFDVAMEKRVRIYQGQRNWIYNVHFDPRENLLFSCSRDSTVRAWDVRVDDPGASCVLEYLHESSSSSKSRGGRAVRHSGFKRRPGRRRPRSSGSQRMECCSCSFNSNLKELMVGCSLGTMAWWDVRAGKKLFQIKVHPGEGTIFGFEPLPLLSVDWRSRSADADASAEQAEPTSEEDLCIASYERLLANAASSEASSHDRCFVSCTARANQEIRIWKLKKETYSDAEKKVILLKHVPSRAKADFFGLATTTDFSELRSNYESALASRRKLVPQPSVPIQLATEMAPFGLQCSYASSCWSFLEQRVGATPEFLDHLRDACFCPSCIAANPKVSPDTPLKDWVQFGIFLDRKEIFGRGILNWEVAYHGAHPDVLWRVLKESAGELLFFEDRLMDGTVLGAVEGHYTGETAKFVYVSPSILYCSLPVYCKRLTWKSKTFIACFKVRIKQGTFERQPETVLPEHRRGEVIDPLFSSQTIEWRTDRRKAIVSTALMVRVVET